MARSLLGWFALGLFLGGAALALLFAGEKPMLLGVGMVLLAGFWMATQALLRQGTAWLGVIVMTGIGVVLFTPVFCTTGFFDFEYPVPAVETFSCQSVIGLPAWTGMTTSSRLPTSIGRLLPAVLGGVLFGGSAVLVSKLVRRKGAHR